MRSCHVSESDSGWPNRPPGGVAPPLRPWAKLMSLDVHFPKAGCLNLPRGIKRLKVQMSLLKFVECCYVWCATCLNLPDQVCAYPGTLKLCRPRIGDALGSAINWVSTCLNWVNPSYHSVYQLYRFGVLHSRSCLWQLEWLNEQLQGQRGGLRRSLCRWKGAIHSSILIAYDGLASLQLHWNVCMQQHRFEARIGWLKCQHKNWQVLPWRLLLWRQRVSLCAGQRSRCTVHHQLIGNIGNCTGELCDRCVCQTLTFPQQHRWFAYFPFSCLLRQDERFLFTNTFILPCQERWAGFGQQNSRTTVHWVLLTKKTGWTHMKGGTWCQTIS